MDSHIWKEKLSTFFSKEELDEIEEYGLQKRLVKILCFQIEESLEAGKEMAEDETAAIKAEMTHGAYYL
jgi:hypothetical protein